MQPINVARVTQMWRDWGASIHLHVNWRQLEGLWP